MRARQKRAFFFLACGAPYTSHPKKFFRGPTETNLQGGLPSGQQYCRWHEYFIHGFSLHSLQCHGNLGYHQ